MNDHEKQIVAKMREAKIPPHTVKSYSQAAAIAKIDDKYCSWEPGERYYVSCTLDGVEYIKIYQ